MALDFGMVDHSPLDDTNDDINGAEVDENSIKLAALLTGADPQDLGTSGAVNFRTLAARTVAVAAGSVQRPFATEWDPSDGSNLTDNASGVGIAFKMPDDADNQDIFASIDAIVVSDATTAEEGELSFSVVTGATLTEKMTLSNSALTVTPAILPAADDGAALGASGTAFSDIFLASGATIDFNGADVTVTHSANTLTVAGGNLVATLGATSILADGVTATTQSASDNSTKVATTAYADAAAAGGVSLSGSTNNTIATVTGADALAGEANLTFDGTSLLEVRGPAANFGVVKISTAELTVVATDELGRIDFQAPLESSGSIGAAAGARISAVAEGTFSSTDNSTSLKFMTSSTAGVVERMRIDSSGNVGIGTSSPSSWDASADQLLVVSNSANSSGADTSNLVLDVTYSTANSAIMFTNGVKALSSAEGVIQYDHNTNSMRFRTSATERMRIDSSGNVQVGSGIATPNTNGDNLVLNGSGNVGLSILGDAASSASIIYLGYDGDEADGRIFYQNSATTPFMDFYVKDTQVMRIDSNGRVGIGAFGTSGYLFDVVSGDTSSNGTIFGRQTYASFAGANVISDASRAATSAYQLLTMRSGGGSDTEFRFDGDGNAYADGSFSGSGADYQEWFESKVNTTQEVGRAVVLDGDQVRYYDAMTDLADDIIGITRPTADNKNSAVQGNTAWNHWTDKYVTDDWGVYEREDTTVYQWKDAEDATQTVVQHANLWIYNGEYVAVDSVTIPDDAEMTTDNVRKLNPSFDPSNNYTPRAGRDEWWLVGLLGQIQVKAGEVTNPRWIKMKDISADVELWYVR